MLARTYGAVARALGSLVKIIPRHLLHLQTIAFTTRQVPMYTARGKDKRSHALPQYTYCITTTPPNPRLYVGTTGSGTIPKRARRPKRRDPHPVPPLRRTRGEGDTSTERRIWRTTYSHPASTPDGSDTSTTLAQRRLCIGARTNRYTILEVDDPKSSPPTKRISGLHRRRTPQRVY